MVECTEGLAYSEFAIADFKMLFIVGFEYDGDVSVNQVFCSFRFIHKFVFYYDSCNANLRGSEKCGAIFFPFGVTLHVSKEKTNSYCSAHRI